MLEGKFEGGPSSPSCNLTNAKSYHLPLLEEAGVSTPPLQVSFFMSHLVITWAAVSIDTHTSVSQLNHIQTKMQTLGAAAVNYFTVYLTGRAYLLSSICATGPWGECSKNSNKTLSERPLGVSKLKKNIF